MHFSVDDYGFCGDFSFDVGVFSDSEGSVGADFTFDTAVDKEVICEADRSFNVNVVAKNVTLSAGWSTAGS